VPLPACPAAGPGAAGAARGAARRDGAVPTLGGGALVEGAAPRARSPGMRSEGASRAGDGLLVRGRPAGAGPPGAGWPQGDGAGRWLGGGAVRRALPPAPVRGRAEGAARAGSGLLARGLAVARRRAARWLAAAGGRGEPCRLPGGWAGGAAGAARGGLARRDGAGRWLRGARRRALPPCARPWTRSSTARRAAGCWRAGRAAARCGAARGVLAAAGESGGSAACRLPGGWAGARGRRARGRSLGVTAPSHAGRGGAWRRALPPPSGGGAPRALPGRMTGCWRTGGCGGAAGPPWWAALQGESGGALPTGCPAAEQDVTERVSQTPPPWW
jgi:hypothetical protein